jgi:hypothetical protein
MIGLLTASKSDYTLLGILQESQSRGGGFLERKMVRIRPVVAIPDIGAAAFAKLEAFEIRNEIRKMRIKGLPISPST